MVSMVKRSAERQQFLSDLLVTAIEHAGYGFPGIVEYEPEPNGNPALSFAVIYDRYDEENEGAEPKTWRVDIDTMAKGLGIARKLPAGGEVADWVRDLLLSDRTNGDDGDYDVLGALLVLECALFGEPTYA